MLAAAALAQLSVDLLLADRLELTVVVEQAHAYEDAAHPARPRRAYAGRSGTSDDPGPTMTRNQKRKAAVAITAVVTKIGSSAPRS